MDMAEGIVFNSSNKSIYIVSVSMNSILNMMNMQRNIDFEPSVPLQINKSHRYARKICRSTELFIYASQYRERLLQLIP